MTRRTTILLVLVCAVVVTAAWRLYWPKRPNVILITIDTLRPDRLSCYGYEGHKTPNLDRLAQEGVLFEEAFCDVTWTTPSMASVMTGRYATAHGMRSSYQRLSKDADTLAELLARRGIQTAAIVASYPLAPIFGLDQGFELYDAEFTEAMIEPRGGRKKPSTNRDEMRLWMAYHAEHRAYRSDPASSDRAIRWLREERQEPFFLWLHYFGPHEKNHPTDDVFEQVRLQREQYDPDVVIADREVGRVLSTLSELELADRTAIIVHADHGQSLTEHDYFGHGRYIYDPGQHVPLLMRLPGSQPAGVRVSRLVRNIDIFPTILDLMRVKLTVPIDGSSLLPLVDGGGQGETPETYVETYLSANRLFANFIAPKTPLGFRRLGVRTPDWKFIINDPIPLVDEDNPAEVTSEMRSRHYSEELYDLREDAAESVNVIGDHRDLAQAFGKKVWSYQALAGSGSEEMVLDETSRERLRALGYLAP